MKKLVVSETFVSIQGEGVTVGIPAVFLRLGGCNILCKSATWICDSVEVWKKGKATEFADVLSSSALAALKKGFHLVITGGEPLMHQTTIVDYLDWFALKYGFTPAIEIETNGTIIPSIALRSRVNYWNCSPKLINSGVSKIKRINETAIRIINSDVREEHVKNVMFKFVINSKKDIVNMIQEYGALIHRANIVLMPAGETQEELNKIREHVVDCCIEFGYRYTDRLHIVVWNQKTGV